MIEYVNQRRATIKVVGVGGGGSNAVNCMIREENGVDDIEFIDVNTDAQALQRSQAPLKIQLGPNVTQGLGAGADPNVGREAAEEDEERLRDMLQGADMVFVAAGMGGGTGTGAAPVVAKIAKTLNILTVGVVTKPFTIEGRQRILRAEAGIQELSKEVDSLIVIPNQRLLGLAGPSTSLQESFTIANRVLINAVRGITDLIHEDGLINVDFADVRTIMSNHGSPNALMGTGLAGGPDRALKAAQEAISSPLLNNVSITGAKNVLINFTGTNNLALTEIQDAAKIITQEIDENALVIIGAVCKSSDEFSDDDIKITVIATGFDEVDSSLDHADSMSTPRQRPVDTSSHNNAYRTPKRYEHSGAYTPEPSHEEDHSNPYSSPKPGYPAQYTPNQPAAPVRRNPRRPNMSPRSHPSKHGGGGAYRNNSSNTNSKPNPSGMNRQNEHNNYNKPSGYNSNVQPSPSNNQRSYSSGSHRPHARPNPNQSRHKGITPVMMSEESHDQYAGSGSETPMAPKQHRSKEPDIIFVPGFWDNDDEMDVLPNWVDKDE